MTQVLRTSYTFNPWQIIITSGATTAIEILCFFLADHGDGFLIPSPYYPGFDKNVKWRSRVDLILIPCRSAENFQLNMSALEKAYIQAQSHGIKVKAVLFTNPNNPVGNIIPEELLHQLLKFVTNKNLNLISDEVFAGSTLEGEEFTSISEILNRCNQYNKSRVQMLLESQKLALAETTGLDEKQINNWFINQRERHWKPSDEIQTYVAMNDTAHSHYFMDNGYANPYQLDVAPALL